MTTQQQGNNQSQIMINQDGKQIPLNNDQVVMIMKKQQEQIQQFAKMLQDKDIAISNLQNDLTKSQNDLEKLQNDSNTSLNVASQQLQISE